MYTAITISSAILLGITFWNIYRLLYNIFWHPLAKFPGPPLAGATKWWKFHLEFINGRSLCHELEGLHEEYGQIIRVGPDELHFSNPQAYNDIYNMKNRWDKEASFYQGLMLDRSTFGFLSYKECKERKDIVSRSFSPSAVSQCEGLLEEKIEKLCTRFSSYPAGQAVDLVYAFQSFTLDVISYLSFGNSFDTLDDPHFRSPRLIALDKAKLSLPFFKYSHLLAEASMSIPPSLLAFINPQMKPMVDIKLVLRNQVKELLKDPKHGLKNLPHDQTIYHRLLDPETYRDGSSVPSERSLNEEALLLLAAGAETVGNALMVGFFHLLRDPSSLGLVKQELKKHWPNAKPEERPSLRELEKLPYLNAVIKESLRLSNGVVSGMPRMVPPGGATISSIYVPAQTIVSCGNTFVHQNPQIFPNPTQFRLERWLDPNSDLDTWLVAFSKGPRMCLGINLAWAELRLVFANVLRKFDMSLAESAPDELKFKDRFLPDWEQHAFAYVKATDEQ